jgi:hypothetical protein
MMLCVTVCLSCVCVCVCVCVSRCVSSDYILSVIRVTTTMVSEMDGGTPREANVTNPLGKKTTSSFKFF